MKNAKVILAFLISGCCSAQTTSLKGKIVDMRLDPMPGIFILISDTVLIGRSDLDGKFEIVVSNNASQLQVRGIGMEEKDIDLPIKCDYLGIILIHAGTFDFMRPGKIDRLRKKDFRKLSDLYDKAFRIGIFPHQEPCFTESFRPAKDRLKEIRRARRKIGEKI